MYLNQTKAKPSIPTFVNDPHRDLDLWPLTSKVNRIHSLTIVDMSANFDEDAHSSLVFIVFTGLFSIIVNSDLDLWSPKSIGFKPLIMVDKSVKFDEEAHNNSVSIVFTRSKSDAHRDGRNHNSVTLYYISLGYNNHLRYLIDAKINHDSRKWTVRVGKEVNRQVVTLPWPQLPIMLCCFDYRSVITGKYIYNCKHTASLENLVNYFFATKRYIQRQIDCKIIQSYSAQWICSNNNA